VPWGILAVGRDLARLLVGAEEGERLLEELRRRSWVDPSVEWETAKQGLAEGQPAGRLLAWDRSWVSSPWHYKESLVCHGPLDTCGMVV
jgi:hypothetical protein